MAKKPQKTVDEMVGARLREARQKCSPSISGAAAGEHVGVSEGQMSRIETGKNSTNPDMLAKLAKLYGCSISFFTQDIEKVKP